MPSSVSRRRMLLSAAVVLAMLAATGCSDERRTPRTDTGTTPDTPGPAATSGQPPIGGERPVQVMVPPGYQPDRPAPLLIMLHGYGGSAIREERYLRFAPVAAATGMLYAIPEGTTDDRGNRFWNATPACCDLSGTGVDDAGYLRDVIEQIRRHYAVDDRRVFLAGVSNGGFMAHRMACDHANVVTAIVSIAGAGPMPGSDCRPARPVAVLQIHGEQDTVIRYEGGTAADAYPGAARTVADWADRNGCAARARRGPDRDLALAADVEAPGTLPLDGPETRTLSYPGGCRPGGHAELWTVTGADHVPRLVPGYPQQVVEFLLAHPRP